MNLLAVRQLTVHAPGRATPVIDALDARAAPGGVWLSGANGVGKSTLLRALAGTWPLRAGGVSLGDHGPTLSPWDEPDGPAGLRWRRAAVACAPEGPPLTHLTVGQWVGFVAGLYEGFDLDAAQRHAQAFGLASAWATPLAAASSGTARKAALAAAMASGARLRLLDEPFNALDAAAERHLRQWLAEHVERCADEDDGWVVVASHVPPWHPDGSATAPPRWHRWHLGATPAPNPDAR